MSVPPLASRYTFNKNRAELELVRFRPELARSVSAASTVSSPLAALDRPHKCDSEVAMTTPSAFTSSAKTSLTFHGVPDLYVTIRGTAQCS